MNEEHVKMRINGDNTDKHRYYESKCIERYELERIHLSSKSL